ncbi:MAG: hypothetical protein ACYTCU_11020 [Planctomycetota bacterium]|jgi:tetratricopeptide (TPR) repeat protein
MNVHLTILLVALIALGGCSGARIEQAVESAQAALDSGDLDRALELTASALPDARSTGDGLMTWRLESIAMLAQAELGRSEEGLAALERLSEPFPKMINAPLYARLAFRASKAGHVDGALDFAEAGLLRYPNRKGDFDGVMADIESRASEDNEALSRLAELGYLSKTPKIPQTPKAAEAAEDDDTR